MDPRNLIKTLPEGFQQAARYLYATIPFSYRYGRTFRQKYALLQRSQWWSKEELQTYQMKELERLLRHAYAHVPYYRNVFQERGLKPGDIQSLDDLSKLPFLTKDIIIRHQKDLLAVNIPESKREYATTGGSSGIPLGMYHEKNRRHANEWAFMLTQWNRVGYRLTDKCVILRGNVLPRAHRGTYWQYNPVYKFLVMSSYNLSENAERYIRKIREFKPKYIQAYPSVISILAGYMKEHEIPPFPSVRAILCGSENLYPSQREFIQDVFQCRVFSWYGHTELAVLAGECETSTDYHAFPEYGIAELLGQDSKPLTRQDEAGEVVATGFNNYVMPFIRYRTGDLATPSCKTCSCGRNYPLWKRVEGRLQEIVVTKDRRLITLTALIFAQHFEAFSKVRSMQLFQEREGEITVRIVKGPAFSPEDEKEILKKMQFAVGQDGLDILFDYVPEIARTKGGKHLFLIQKLPLRDWRT